MTSLTNPSHQELSQALEQAGISTGASEAHGVICGVLSAATEEKKMSSWVPVLLAERDPTRKEDVEFLSKMLVSLHEQSQAWLRQDDFKFRLLVSSDKAKLSLRVTDLAQWCSGYLLGLVAGGAGDVEQLPGEAPEIVKDMLRISEVIPGGGSSEQQEKDLIELVEYVRLGAHAVYDEIHRQKASQ